MMTIDTPHDKQRVHTLALALQIIKTIGEDAVDEAVQVLTYHQKVRANDLAPCDPGYIRDANGNCVKNPVPPDPTHQ